MKSEDQAKITYLKDYAPVNFKVKNVNLHFDIYNEHVIVDNHMIIECSGESIELYGAIDFKLHFIKLNNENLAEDAFTREGESLKIKVTKNNFSLQIRTEIFPHKNLSLNGLYFAGGSYFTQNEPHGFRQMTFYGDRPDVLSIFETKITADKKYQYLLSNGNLIEKGDDPKNSSRHFQVWRDPFPKPCYLFALVVGNFDVLKDKFVTKSSKVVNLELYVDKGKTAESHHAMESLIRSMKWDEENYNLEYDLDIYMTVAADSFNMGAMENKGLNIFNSKYILGNLRTATDDDLEAIEAVVAHEYFHNWTGNRVTCRDWFQLTLKEGLTVFREHQFTADQHGQEVKRIKDVQLLRQRQFEEDAGPLSHPIRPSSYIEMNNFYTATVYEKGAEVIRVLHSIVGPENFKKSIVKYFELFDGSAATVEDFILAFHKTTKRDFTTFMHWYETHGTPHIKVTQEHTQSNIIKIKLEQYWSSNQQEKLVDLPFKIAWPGVTGLLDFEIEKTQCENSEILKSDKKEILVLMRDKSIEFNCHLPPLSEKSAFSFNRGFTSPVQVEAKFDLKSSMFLAQYDTDLFNKWDICQSLLMHYMQQELKAGLQVASDSFADVVSSIWSNQLDNKGNNNNFTSLFFALPSEDEINEKLPIFQFEQVRQLCLTLIEKIAKKNTDLFKSHFMKLKDNELSWSPQDVGIRKLKNRLQDFLIAAGDKDIISHAKKIIESSESMNQQYAALCSLNRYNLETSVECNEVFIKRNEFSSLLIDKWFVAQMCNRKADDLTIKVSSLMQSKYFDLKIPNRVYSLFISWMGNLASFNSSKNSGYALMKKMVIEIDQFNPQVASRILKSLKPLSKLPTNLKTSLKLELEEIHNIKNISKDSLEIVGKFLKG